MTRELLIARALRAARRYKALPLAYRRAAWARWSRGLVRVAGEPETEWDLQLANALEALHDAVANGADEAVLHAANELDRIDAALREQAARVSDSLESGALLWGGLAVALLLAVAVARR